MKLPWSADRLPRLDGYRPAAVGAVVLACIVVAGSGFIWFGHRAWLAFVPQLTPSCSWPLRVYGKATPEQAGLVRCYLQATADHDAIGLNLLAGKGPFARIGNASSAHSGLMNMIAMGGSSAWRMTET